MSERRPASDLRLRMQRVAVKPVSQKPARARHPRDGTDRRRDVPRGTTVEAAKAPESRLQTLLAWARWELAVVPEERWQWLMAVTRPGVDPPGRESQLTTRRARGN